MLRILDSGTYERTLLLNSFMQWMMNLLFQLGLWFHLFQHGHFQAEPTMTNMSSDFYYTNQTCQKKKAASNLLTPQ